MKNVLFNLGKLVATPGCLAAVPVARILECLERHVLGDWGTVGLSDWRANDAALKHGSRIFSVYKINELDETSDKFWIITTATGDDGTRESTCALLPSEY